METPEQAARRIFAKHGLELEALHIYQHADGNPWFWRARLKDPKGQKEIRPMRLNGAGYELKEPKFDDLKPLYLLPELAANPDKTVWFVEGEKCADCLAILNVLSTTSGGSISDSKADFAPLANRDVVLWPDHDEEGLKHAVRVADKLLAVDAKVRVVEIDKLDLPDTGDCVDWLKEHPNATADDLDKLNTVDYIKAEVVEAEPAGKSQATHLTELIQDADLFHDADGKGYATYKVNDHKETWPIHKCKVFKDWVCFQYYKETQHGANNTAWQTAYMTLTV